MPSEPVLLVHGFASSFELNWREPGWVDLLTEAGRTVIGVDLLGHGSAEKPHEPEAYAHLEDCVAERLPTDGKVDAIGFSMGARVLLGVASEQPERFGRIVVAGVGANLLRAGSADGLAQAVEAGSQDTDVILNLFSRFAGAPGNDREALAACLRRPEKALTKGALARIAGPVLVVLGEEDFAGPADPLVDALPDARLVTIPRCDHFATPKHFTFIDSALEFLDAVPTF